MPVELFPCRISEGRGKGTKLGEGEGGFSIFDELSRYKRPFHRMNFYAENYFKYDGFDELPPLKGIR